MQDFLFTYYAFSPAALRRWHPGLGFRVRRARPGMQLEESRGYVAGSGGAEVDARVVAARAGQRCAR